MVRFKEIFCLDKGGIEFLEGFFLLFIFFVVDDVGRSWMVDVEFFFWFCDFFVLFFIFGYCGSMKGFFF